MKLIQTLNEASGLNLADLKKALSKDDRVKAIFKKSLDLDELSNKAEFLRTIKFFVLNNRNVLDFVDERDGVRNLNKTTLKSLRTLDIKDLTQDEADRLHTFVNDLFREYNVVGKSTISASTRKEIVEWLNGNGRYFNLSSTARKELASVPDIRPEKPIVLYRGLLFKSHDLRERKRYDGTLEVGKGLKFLRSIRDGSRVVDLEWDRPSSWTTDRDVALKFAQFGPASSNFEATLNWLSRKDKIDGDLGFLISTLARPEDILIDTQYLSTATHLKHGDEREIILAPGNYTCRVNTKFTKTGEVDPLTTSGVDEETSEVLAAAKSLFSKLEEFSVPVDIETGNSYGFRLEFALRNEQLDAIKYLATKGARIHAVSNFESVLDFFKNHLGKIDTQKLEDLLHTDEHGKLAAWLADQKKDLSAKQRHPDHKSSANPRGEVRIGDMSAAQVREASTGMMSTMLSSIHYGARFTDWSSGSAIRNLARVFAPDLSVESLEKKAGKIQKEVIDQVVDGYLTKLNIDKPANQEEAFTKMKNSIRSIERTAMMFDRLKRLKKSVSDLTNQSDA